MSMLTTLDPMLLFFVTFVGFVVVALIIVGSLMTGYRASRVLYHLDTTLTQTNRGKSHETTRDRASDDLAIFIATHYKENR